MDLFVFAIIASIIILGMAAVQWGVDTRSLNIDPRRSSVGDLS